MQLQMQILIILISLATTFAESETKPSGLKIEYVEKPTVCDKTAEKGMLLSMHYTGSLVTGTKFDSSLDRNEPFKFQLGVGQVIRGWDEGIEGMCVGEKRILTVPPELGYGQQGAGDSVPGDATLIFDIELMDVEEGPPPINVFKEIDVDNDGVVGREELSEYLQKLVEEAKQVDPENYQGMADDHYKMVEDIFNHEDRDRDGFISFEEFSGPKHDEL